MQRDVCILLLRYIKKDAIIDILANVPILYYFGAQDAETTNELLEDHFFVVCMAMKTLRLWHAGAVADTVRRLMDVLADIFYLKRYVFDNLNRWIMAGMKFLVAVHYFACVWILIHRVKD